MRSRSTRSEETRCARCGRPVEPGQYLCAQCREEVGPAASIQPPRREAEQRRETEQEERRRRWPKAMVRPSPVQYHATIMVTIFLVLLGLGLWAFLNNRGVGPFEATVVGRTAWTGAVVIEVVVRNEGSKDSRATCTFTAIDAQDIEITRDTELTPRIPAGGELTVHHAFGDLARAPDDYRVACT